jgi:hypothetical protein
MQIIMFMPAEAQVPTIIWAYISNAWGSIVMAVTQIFYRQMLLIVDNSIN